MGIASLGFWVLVLIVIAISQWFGRLNDDYEFARKKKFYHFAGLYKEGLLYMDAIEKEFFSIRDAFGSDVTSPDSKAYTIMKERHPEWEGLNSYFTIRDYLLNVQSLASDYWVKMCCEKHKDEWGGTYDPFMFSGYDLVYSSRKQYERLKEGDEKKNKNIAEAYAQYLWRGASDEQKKTAEDYKIDLRTGKYLEDWNPVGIFKR